MSFSQHPRHRFSCFPISVLFLISTLLLENTYYTNAATKLFDFTKLEFNGTAIRTPLDFTITFNTSRAIGPDEVIILHLPRFTRQFHENSTFQPQNVSFKSGEILISPSWNLEAAWIEGDNFGDFDDPYPTARLYVRPRTGTTIVPEILQRITVHRESGIGAYCGHPNSFVYSGLGTAFRYAFTPFQISSTFPYNGTDLVGIYPNITAIARNITAFNDSTVTEITTYTGLGDGCTGNSSLSPFCNNNGRCNYCTRICDCFSGYGNPDTDIVSIGSSPMSDCSEKVCPSGRAVPYLPLSANQAHGLAECSNMGLCNRSTGSCLCFPPFTGLACERTRCPNDCSGHGECISIEDYARMETLRYSNYTPQHPLYENLTYSVQYGTANGLDTTAWDYSTIYGCICDSKWPVGFNYGETQLAEYFGPDCSLKRCPSGSDPYTGVDDTDCFFKNQLSPGGLDRQRGAIGNKCHIECSNRGICNHKSGTCKCFPGVWGEACDQVANAGLKQIHFGPESNLSTFIQEN